MGARSVGPSPCSFRRGLERSMMQWQDMNVFGHWWSEDVCKSKWGCWFSWRNPAHQLICLCTIEYRHIDMYTVYILYDYVYVIIIQNLFKILGRMGCFHVPYQPLHQSSWYQEILQRSQVEHTFLQNVNVGWLLEAQQFINERDFPSFFSGTPLKIHIDITKWWFGKMYFRL